MSVFTISSGVPPTGFPEISLNALNASDRLHIRTLLPVGGGSSWLYGEEDCGSEVCASCVLDAAELCSPDVPGAEYVVSSVPEVCVLCGVEPVEPVELDDVKDGIECGFFSNAVLWQPDKSTVKTNITAISKSNIGLLIK